MKHKKSLKGFTIIEVIVALFVLSVSLLGFFQVSNFIIARINTSDYRISAVNYATGGLEIVRGIRDNFISKNINNGWNDEETTEVDSFIELVATSESGEFKIVPLVGQSFSNDDISDGDILSLFNGYTFEPIENIDDKTNWELVAESGFTQFLRKIKVEHVDGERESLRKITISVYFDDGTYNDTIHISTYLGDLGLNNSIET